MANASVKNIQIGSLVAMVKRNIGIVLTVLLLLLVAMEFFIIKDTAGILTGPGASVSAPVPAKSAVRVNFTDYDAAISRIQAAETYTATGTVSMPVPFGVPTPR